MASSIFVAGTTLKDAAGTTLDISDQDDGEIAISVDGGDLFVFKASESDTVIGAIREMADRVMKRTGLPESTKADAATVAKNARSSR